MMLCKKKSLKNVLAIVTRHESSNGNQFFISSIMNPLGNDLDEIPLFHLKFLSKITHP